jgi:hypothetical protein
MGGDFALRRAKAGGQSLGESTMSGKFVLKKGSSGKFHFNLVAGNGQVIATSET